MLLPLKNKLPHPAKKQALPRPVEIDKPAGRSGAKLTADSIDTPFNYARDWWCLKVKGRKSREIFKFFFVYIFWLSASQKYLLKVRGDNVFIDQNIIIHYKYLHNNIRTVVEFLDQSIYAFFCPAPRIFVLAPPRPAGKSSAPHIPDKVIFGIYDWFHGMMCAIRPDLVALSPVLFLWSVSASSLPFIQASLALVIIIMIQCIYLFTFYLFGGFSFWD